MNVQGRIIRAHLRRVQSGKGVLLQLPHPEDEKIAAKTAIALCSMGLGLMMNAKNLAASSTGNPPNPSPPWKKTFQDG